MRRGPPAALHLPPLHLGARTFPNSLVLHTDLQASEYGDVWKAGYALGELLERHVGREHLQGRNVLELGAGCGYAGLVAAVLGSTVVLIDRKDLIRVLQRNVAENMKKLPKQPAIEELDWAQGTQRNQLAAKYPRFDYILCSDCMYEEDCIDPLITTLKAFSTPQSGSASPGAGTGCWADETPEIIFTIENRGPGSDEIHKTFFSKMQKCFTVIEITCDCCMSKQGQLASDLRAFTMRRTH